MSAATWLGNWPLTPDPRPDAPDSPCALRVGRVVELRSEWSLAWPPPTGLITAIDTTSHTPWYLLDLGYGQARVPGYAIRYILGQCPEEVSMPSPPQPLFRVGQAVALAVAVDDWPAGIIVTIQDCRAVPGAVRCRVAVAGAPSFWVGEDELDPAGVQGELPLEPSSA